MALPQRSSYFDRESYLAWEINQDSRHEFFQGEVFAMAGARRTHVTVTLNLATALKYHLRGSHCRAYMSDMKLQVQAADAVFYPDVMVSCDGRDHRAELVLEHPRLLIEVLSDSTAAFDRGGKFAACRQLESLLEYVLVDIEARRVECFRRSAEGLWVLYEFAGEGDIELASVDLRMPLAEVFENVDVGEEEPSNPETSELRNHE